MSCLQSTLVTQANDRMNRPPLVLRSHRLPLRTCVLPIDSTRSGTASLKLSASASASLQFAPLSRHQRRTAVLTCPRKGCVTMIGGRDQSASKDEGSPWKAFENAMGSFKKQSIEDLLREQMQKQEYYDGGSGENPPRGGGSSGGSSGNGSGDSEDEGFAGILDETLQVILATLGFIFLYVYIITGEELYRLAKDYIKYLFGGTKSVRLRRAMDNWKRFIDRLTKEKKYDKYWLEKAIIRTPTWFDSPEKYRQMLSPYLVSDAEEEY